MAPRTTEPRTKPTMVRWTPAEITTVTERARSCGLTVARFIRECALGAVPKATRHVDQKALLRELARSGNNLNQLAHEANARDLFPAQEKIEAALTFHMAALRKLAADPEK
jgi:hypothetical protein